MKLTREQVRQQLEEGMAVFLGSGKQIIKVQTVKPRQRREKENMVEIEIDHLPQALREKHFAK